MTDEPTVDPAWRDPAQLPLASEAELKKVRRAEWPRYVVGLGAFGFHDVWVERAESGKPSLALAGRAAELAASAGVVTWHLSLTHSDVMAAAYVIAE